MREANERAAASLGGLHIPLMSLPSRLGEIESGCDIVVYCKSGVRSAKAALHLRSVLSAVTVYSLAGGTDGAQCSLSAAA